MPRYSGPRSRKRNNKMQLEVVDEVDATEWGGFECIAENNTADDYKALWRQHGEKILAQWIKCCPGSRPWSWYISTGTPLPPMTRETGERPLRIVSGTIIHHAPLHGAGKEHELEHLKKHNAVSSDEEKAARIRISTGDLLRYEMLSQPTPTAT